MSKFYIYNFPDLLTLHKFMIQVTEDLNSCLSNIEDTVPN